jgi:replication initiation and membrane attachment protein
VDWQNSAKSATTTTPYKRKNVRDEKVPEWFYKAKENRSTKQSVENEVTEDWETKKQQLLEKLGVTEGQAKTSGTNK